jgi:3-oxoadipate enol-lactonase
MLFAERHPERVQKLILCDTAHKIGTSASWNQRIEQVNTVGLAGISDAVMEKWFPESFRNTQVSELIGYRTMLERCCPKGYIQCCEAIRDADLTENVQKSKQKPLCSWLRRPFDYPRISKIISRLNATRLTRRN